MAAASFGCNPAARLEAEARKLQEGGDTDAAVTKLKQLTTDSPKSPEALGAGVLAASWLVQAADQVAVVDDKRARLNQALGWDPKNAQAQLRVCELDREMPDFSALRVCLATLAPMVDVPVDRAESLRASLAAHDEMNLWSASAEPEDWLRLIDKHPASETAPRVTKKILAHYTICDAPYRERTTEDILAVTDHVVARAVSFGEYAAQASDMDEARNRFATGLSVIVENQKMHLKGLHNLSREIASHAFLPAEAAAHAKLMQYYSGLILIVRRWISLESVAVKDSWDDPIKAFNAVAISNTKRSNIERLARLDSDAGDDCSTVVNGSTRPAIVRQLAASHLTAGGSPVDEGRGESAESRGAVEGLPIDSQEGPGRLTDALIDSWLRSQNTQDFEAYSRLYAPDFVGIKRSGQSKKEYDLTGWLDDRRGMFARAFTVKVSDQRVEARPDGATVVRFTQEWSSPRFADAGTKELVLRKGEDGLRIIREEQLDSKSAPQDQRVNTTTGTSATKAEDQMRTAYDDSRRSLTERPDALGKVELSQKAWEAYRDAHALERFPRHLDDPMFYGSVLPTCLATERDKMTLTRVHDLRSNSRCDGVSTEGEARAAAQSADVALNDVYRKIRSAYSADPAFIAALKQAQLAWLGFRDAQVNFAEASNGGTERTCADLEMGHLVRARTEEIRQWLRPIEEGDVCAGSYGPP